MTQATPREQGRTLRRLFLTIMMRGRRVRQGGKKQRVSTPWVMFALTLATFIALGFLAFVYPPELLVFSACLHSLTFMMVGLHLATTSGQLLFNPEEAEVLLHRPISARALLSAKLQAIGFFALSQAIALNLVGLYLGATQDGADWRFIPAHLISSTLQVFFAIGLVVLAYNLCLRWFGRERLENLMTLLQIVAALTIMLAGQIAPRMLRTASFDAMDLPAWALALPPIWFAAMDSVLTGQSLDRTMILLTSIGLVATIGIVWLSAVRMATTYQEGLEVLNESSTAATRKSRRKTLANGLLRLPLLRTWLRDPREAASFRLTLAYLGRSRDMKLRVYPMLAQMSVVPLVFLLSGTGSGAGSGFQGMIGSLGISYVGFFVATLPILVLESLRMSEDHEATTIFHQAPLESAEPLFQGARKAVIILMCVPITAVLVIVGAFALKDKSLLFLVLPGLLSLQVFSLVPAMVHQFLPLAEPIENVSRGCKMAVLILGFQFGSMALAAGFGWLWVKGGFWWSILAEALITTLVARGLRTTFRSRRIELEE